MLFIKRLQEKCEQKGIKCKIVSGYLTTKICGNCFGKNEVGDKKEYICKFCNIKHERDVNAARNIYILEILKQKAEDIIWYDAGAYLNAVKMIAFIKNICYSVNL